MMFALKRTSSPSTASAAAARARLLHDRTMRRNADLPTIDAVFAPEGALSPGDQKHQVLRVLRSFEHFYLAELHYNAALQTTTAVVRPTAARQDAPHAIRIDAQGNLIVARLHPHRKAADWRDRRNKLLLGGLAALVVALLALLVLV